MSTLIRKELRALLPFIALVALFHITGILDELLTKIPHLRSAAILQQEIADERWFGSVMYLVLSLALTYGLLVRERDDGTQEFLDALPISRTSIFVAKVTAVLMLIGLSEVLEIGTFAILHQLSRTSLDRGVHLEFLATRALLNFCQFWVFISLGLALSFLRRFGWLVAGLLIWTYLLVRQFVPEIEVLNIIATSETNMLGQRLVIPWKLLIVQGALSCVLMAISYSLYLGAGDRLLRSIQNLDHSRRGSAVLLACSFGIVVVAGSLFFLVDNAMDDTGEEVPEFASATFPSWNTSRASSEHYRFVYPTNLAGHIRPLVDAADSVHERVREFFQAPVGAPIEVDATDALPSHLAGFAKWDKIRLDTTAVSNHSNLESVLGHETAHVFLERLSDLRLTDQFNSTRFFHEGVASYVEYHLFEPRQAADVFYATASVMHSRKLLDFDEMVDDDRFSAHHDLDLAYPLGLVFVESLVERYERPAVTRLASAMARENAPQDLEGLDLWRDTFQACGYNLDEVLDVFFVRLDREVEQRRAWIDSIPRPRAVLDFLPRVVELKVLMDDSDEWTPICRFRQSEHTPQLQYLDAHLDENNTCRMYRSIFPSGVVWYQVGVIGRKGITIYEPWRSAAIKSR